MLVNFFLPFGGFFLVWSALSFPLSSQELIYGLILSLLVSLVNGYYHRKILTLKVSSFFAFAKFIVVLLAELVKANLNVAKIVLNPKLPISPKIIKVNTSLRSPVAQTLLANSITLTPGTISVELDDNTLFIHTLEGDLAEDPETLKGPFERILKEVFEA